MAATSILAAAIQLIQVNPVWRRPENLAAVLKDYWMIGGWSLGGNVVNAMRFNAVIWLTAALAGRAEVAQYQAALPPHQPRGFRHVVLVLPVTDRTPPMA